MTNRLMLLVWTCLPLLPWCQIERGELSVVGAPSEVKAFFNDDNVKLKDTRKMGHLLTDRDITSTGRKELPKRRKAVIRHIKHLNEILEQYYQDRGGAKQTIYETIWELELFYLSYLQKAEAMVKDGVSTGDVIRMYRDTRRSAKVLRYDTSSSHVHPDPVDSPYWHAIPDSIPPHKRFGQLADFKDIKTRKHMVVLFDKLSQDGSAPKVKTLDLNLDDGWSLKWGDEVHTDVLGSRIFAALGYDVDHPYFYGKDRVTLIFDTSQQVRDASDLISSIREIYQIDLSPFISSHGLVDTTMVAEDKKLAPFLGRPYARFFKCALEARPDRVKRMGSFLPDQMLNPARLELRGALLAHLFIGNWDTRQENTLLTTVHTGNHHYRASAVFSDLGTSFGVKLSKAPSDFKVGLVNEFGWEVMTCEKGKLKAMDAINSILTPYEEATYSDMQWMAGRIATLDSTMLWKMVKKAKWPDPIAQLYFHKLASRRADILASFSIPDPHPIPFDRDLTVVENGVKVVENGILKEDYKPLENPESFTGSSGRLTNYGR